MHNIYIYIVNAGNLCQHRPFWVVQVGVLWLFCLFFKHASWPQDLESQLSHFGNLLSFKFLEAFQRDVKVSSSHQDSSKAKVIGEGMSSFQG